MIRSLHGHVTNIASPHFISFRMQSSGSAGHRSSKGVDGQENVPGGGNAVERRTPHFAPLPPSSGSHQYSEGSGGRGGSEDMNHSDQVAAEDGDEAKVNKKMTRVAQSLMSKHLRRKSLVSVFPCPLSLSYELYAGTCIIFVSNLGQLRCGWCAVAGTKEVDGRRVSTRRKMKPLRWWCSETKTYCRKHQSAFLSTYCPFCSSNCTVCWGSLCTCIVDLELSPGPTTTPWPRSFMGSWRPTLL